MKLIFHGHTDVGRKRTHNEDNFFLLPEESLFVVCDGMGGHASGEVASQIVVDSMREFYVETAEDPDRTWPFKEVKSKCYESNRMSTAVRLGNYRVHEQSVSDPKYKGMGTTCVAMLFVDSKVIVGHVGDSRCYRVRGNEIDQLTEDHSLLNDYKKMTKMTAEEEANFPHKNIIVRALGMKEDVVVDTNEFDINPDDIYISCSDGLNGELTDDEILEITLENRGDPETTTHCLIEAANAHGGKDNVTVAVVQIESA